MTAQVVPLSVYEFGEAVSPVWAAWKPMSTDAPGAMVALWETFLAVTRPDAGEQSAFQAEVMVWPLGRVKARDQPSIVATPVLVRVMFEVSPVFQPLAVWVTRQTEVPGDGVEF